LSGRTSKGGRYNKLDDEETGPGRRRLRGVDEEEEEAVGYDLSGLDGMHLKKFEPQKKVATATAGLEQERELNEAGYAAEFERLEAQLGSGMSSVVEKPFTHKPVASLEPKSSHHKRGLSGSDRVSAQGSGEDRTHCCSRGDTC
jgi:hypothetical protein